MAGEGSGASRILAVLDFCFIPDEMPMHRRGLALAGGIEQEEFEQAQELEIVESHLDYYGKFRWSSQNVQQKCFLLTSASSTAIPRLAAMLEQASAANCGLVAFGD